MAKAGEYEVPEDLYYSEDLIWAKVEPDKKVKCGLTDYGAKISQNIVYIELPIVGTAVTKGEVIGTAETVKAVGEIKAPLSGTVTAVNEDAINDPSLITSDPYGKGWFVVIQPSNLDADVKELMDGRAAIEWFKKKIAESS
ncbi:MAG: glycine cleavage system protein H [Euryarchaeota archaeon]|nr:glycine cleavage system protein H [Euryarchaeota archaeon]